MFFCYKVVANVLQNGVQRATKWCLTLFQQFCYQLIKICGGLEKAPRVNKWSLLEGARE